jgi:hypothetical protein
MKLSLPIRALDPAAEPVQDRIIRTVCTVPRNTYVLGYNATWRAPLVMKLIGETWIWAAPWGDSTFDFPFQKIDPPTHWAHIKKLKPRGRHAD